MGEQARTLVSGRWQKECRGIYWITHAGKRLECREAYQCNHGGDGIVIKALVRNSNGTVWKSIFLWDGYGKRPTWPSMKKAAIEWADSLYR